MVRMSFVSQVLGGNQATTSIVNSTSAGGSSTTILFYGSVKTTNSGAMTANTLKQMLNISGSAGSMSVLGVYTNDATARTVRMKVTIDGVVVYDATSNSIGVSNAGHLVAGAYAYVAFDDGNPIRWRTSCLVEIASNLTETDKLTFGYKYMLES